MATGTPLLPQDLRHCEPACSWHIDDAWKPAGSVGTGKGVAGNVATTAGPSKFPGHPWATHRQPLGQVSVTFYITRQFCSPQSSIPFRLWLCVSGASACSLCVSAFSALCNGVCGIPLLRDLRESSLWGSLGSKDLAFYLTVEEFTVALCAQY